jgi:hypothetical protein
MVLFGTPSPHCAVLLRLTPSRHLSLSLCPLRLHGPVEGGRALCMRAHISARLCGGLTHACAVTREGFRWEADAPSCTHTTLHSSPHPLALLCMPPTPQREHPPAPRVQRPPTQYRHCIPSHPQSGGNGAGAGGRTPASDSIWWTRLIVDAVTGDKAAVTELAAAAE